MSDIGIVGGGMLGLTLAHRLTRGGHAVTIYEASPTIGGLASTVAIGDVTWDRFYHVILQSDQALLGLLEEIGLGDAVEWRPTGTGLFHDGRLYPVSTAIDYAKLPVLSPVAKGRIGATVLRAAYARDWRRLETITAREWLTRWSGTRAYARFWQPLLRAKLGEMHDRASAAFIWAIIQRLYAARRAGMKQDLFGYVAGGYATVLPALEQSVRGQGATIHTGNPVRSVAAREGGVVVETDVDSVHDHVIVTLPSSVVPHVVAGLSEAERDAHSGIDYLGVVCVVLVLDAPLGDYYVTNITDGSMPFTGVIDMTALVDRRVFDGRGLVYLPYYAAPDDPIFGESSDAIVERTIDALAAMHPDFAAERVLGSSVGRASHVLPVSTVGYSQRLPSLQTSVPGVSVVNTAHIVNGTLNVDETVQLADAALEELAPALETRVAS